MGALQNTKKISLLNVRLERLARARVCVCVCARARVRVRVIIWGLNYVSWLPVISLLRYFTLLY
jgi:hypothetical protein